MFNFLIAVLVLFCLAIIGWHIFLALMGGVIIITGGAWAALLLTVCAICAAIFSVFFLVSIGVIFMAAFAGLWMLGAIIFFPVLFPVLLPLFLLFLVIYFMKRKRQNPRA